MAKILLADLHVFQTVYEVQRLIVPLTLPYLAAKQYHITNYIVKERVIWEIWEIIVS